MVPACREFVAPGAAPRLGAPSPMMGAKPRGMGPGAGANAPRGQVQLHCMGKI